mgnify:CR=1 FL=1
MHLPYHNTEIRHMNPGQTEPLVFPVQLLVYFTLFTKVLCQNKSKTVELLLVSITYL